MMIKKLSLILLITISFIFFGCELNSSATIYGGWTTTVSGRVINLTFASDNSFTELMYDNDVLGSTKTGTFTYDDASITLTYSVGSQIVDLSYVLDNNTLTLTASDNSQIIFTRM